VNDTLFEKVPVKWVPGKREDVCFSDGIALYFKTRVIA
jgi:hypothetical protein